jgi:hypothetical protein
MISHGTATIKGTLQDAEGGILVDVGEQGIITAYLPVDETFAVMFPDNKGWYTFKETEEEFNNRFEVTLDDNQPDSSND